MYGGDALSRRNKSKYAILGMLSLKPMTGYDIKKNLEQGIGNFWNESFSQIYPILKQLTADGLATVTIEKQDGKPNRKVYHITEQGKNLLMDWLAEPIAGHYPMRIELLLKLFFAHHAEHHIMIAHVERFQTEINSKLREYEEINQKLSAKLNHHKQPALAYRRMTLQFGIHFCKAVLAWCKETIEQLKAYEKKESDKSREES